MEEQSPADENTDPVRKRCSMRFGIISLLIGLVAVAACIFLPLPLSQASIDVRRIFLCLTPIWLFGSLFWYLALSRGVRGLRSARADTEYSKVRPVSTLLLGMSGFSICTFFVMLPLMVPETGSGINHRETHAALSLKSIFSAQSVFSRADYAEQFFDGTPKEFARSLQELSDERCGLIKQQLADAIDIHHALDGYYYKLISFGPTNFLAAAIPEKHGSSGINTFVVGIDGVILGKDLKGEILEPGNDFQADSTWFSF